MTDRPIHRYTVRHRLQQCYRYRHFGKAQIRSVNEMGELILEVVAQVVWPSAERRDICCRNCLFTDSASVLADIEAHVQIGLYTRYRLPGGCPVLVR